MLNWVKNKTDSPTPHTITSPPCRKWPLIIALHVHLCQHLKKRLLWGFRGSGGDFICRAILWLRLCWLAVPSAADSLFPQMKWASSSGPNLAARCTEMRMSLCASAPAWSFVVSVLHGGCELLSLVIPSGGVGWVVYGEGEVNWFASCSPLFDPTAFSAVSLFGNLWHADDETVLTGAYAMAGVYRVWM